MTLSSMTGFASTRGAGGGITWVWEARSVNARGLDLRVRLPQGWERLDPTVRELAGKRFKRGTISISLATSQTDTLARYALNEPHLNQLLDLIRPLQERGDVAPPSADGLLAIRGVLEPVEDDVSAASDETLEASIRKGLETMLGALAENRQAEGARLGEIVGEQVARIGALAHSARAHPSRTSDAIRERLSAQVSALLDASASFDTVRLHQEAALLAAKADIAEELDRLDGHVEAATALLTGGGAVGRRLDFLAQECHREANTLTAKSVHRDVTAIGLDLKVVVDQLREQVANLE
ncbi:YicC/YloC family endoribonuclease [Amorphus coralli]|uniref:YicC/YloC family endoribonuclease n=1 Tax=Amorphus coralli TaxID=340680 RepID=UPI000367195B|nr:YicC/YloC family endoribonuclease [Amorphus coralli]